MICDDPICLAKYVRYKDLLDKSGWKQLCCYMKNAKKMNHFIKSSKAKQRRHTVKINFGIYIPCEHKHAMMFDADKRNTNWKDDYLLDLKHMYKFNFFNYIEPFTNGHIPPGHTKIQVHYNQGRRYKARMRSYGNITGPNLYT